jgi:hypothetical protein
MANTTNFNWETPDDTDLVKDGAAAMRTLGNSIDTSFVDLKGGTTGQILSKASNTDLDYTWVTTDDANAIQNAIVDAKGDLIAASAADTPARLAVGNNGETLVADSSTSTGLRYQTGVSLNGVINGAMDCWQRGTSFASTGNTIYTADRWASFRAALGLTVSRQTASLEGFQYSLRAQRDSGNTSTAINYVIYSMETNDSVRYANKPVTLSFWAKAGANYSSASSALGVQWTTGTGTDQKVIDGYTGASNIVATNATLTTSWQRFSFTGTAASNTNEMGFLIYNTPVGTAGANDWFEITGVQVEFGSVATNFKRAGGGTIQGELAACQRYYEKSYNTDVAPATTTDAGVIWMFQDGSTSTLVQGQIFYKVTKRGTPTLTIYSPVGGATGVVYNNKSGANVTATALGNGASNGTFYTNIGTAGTGYAGKFHYVAELEL